MLVGLQNAAQILTQAQTETAHATIEEHAQGQNKARNNVKPLLAERTGVGMGSHYRIVVQVAQYLCVLGVGQIVDNLFQLLHNLFDGLVVARTEEYVDGVGQMQ